MRLVLRSQPDWAGVEVVCCAAVLGGCSGWNTAEADNHLSKDFAIGMLLSEVERKIEDYPTYETWKARWPSKREWKATHENDEYAPWSEEDFLWGRRRNEELDGPLVVTASVEPPRSWIGIPILFLGGIGPCRFSWDFIWFEMDSQDKLIRWGRSTIEHQKVNVVKWGKVSDDSD